MLQIHSIETFGTHEGPGIRLVIFTQGCNMRCLYCHNADAQELKGGREISGKEILTLLEKERPYFSSGGGLTVSGGEPTLHASELLELFAEVKKAGFNTALDTNGSIVSNEVKDLYDLADLVLLDVKHIDPEWHRKITGMDNQNTLTMAEYREKQKKPLWLRYVLVPAYSDQPEFMRQWAEHFKGYKMIERVEILPYHKLGSYKYGELGRIDPLADTGPPSLSSIAEVEMIFKEYFENVVVQ